MSMTAVAHPSSYPSNLSRNGWTHGNNNTISANAMNTDDLQRVFVPRKSARRTPSTSSLSSNSSTSSTSSSATVSLGPLTNGEPAWAARKKSARGIWPKSKADPVSGISTGRAQSSVATASSSAASGLSALHNGGAILPQQHVLPSQSQPNGILRNNSQSEMGPVLHLSPLNGTFERKAITVPYAPDVLKIGRQTNNKTFPTPSNGYFDSKVLSRQHAEIWADREGKVWIRDVKSSNGTFVNGKRLSQENRDSEPHPLKEGDLLELGIDIVSEDQKTVVHHKVASKVEHAGLYGMSNGMMDLGFSDLDSSMIQQQHPGQGFRRNSSQSSAASRLSAANNYPHVTPHHQKWLQPVTLEQIVRKLNTELRNAHHQAQDLSDASNFVDVMLTQGHTSQPPNASPKQSSPVKPGEFKVRFAAEPPAPPPSQPLPKEPGTLNESQNHDSGPIHPGLSRAETERPKTGMEASVNGASPKAENDSQIFTLVEALRKAEREIHSQADRLKEMELALKEEREARNTAEQKAVRLETGNTSSNGVKATEEDEILQNRLESMRLTIDEMKEQMETYRRRAESAEDESKRDRQSLADMIESIRLRELAAASKKKSRKMNGHAITPSLPPSPAKSTTSSETSPTQPNDEANQEHTPIDDSFSDDDLDGEVGSILTKHITATQLSSKGLSAYGTGLPPLSDTQLKELSRVVALATENLRKGGHIIDGNGGVILHQSQTAHSGRLAQSAPYVSIISVMVIGVGMMAWLNNWQKVEH